MRTSRQLPTELNMRADLMLWDMWGCDRSLRISVDAFECLDLGDGLCDGVFLVYIPVPLAVIGLELFCQL